MLQSEQNSRVFAAGCGGKRGAKMNFQACFRAVPVIAILRGIRPDEVIEVGNALADSGILLAEIPLNSPEALCSIRRAAEYFHPRGTLLIGAGTVLSAAEVMQVHAAGGAYIISPNYNPAVVKAAGQCALTSIPGVVTPTEAVAAMEAGADLLKVFPAGSFGPGYFRDLRAVIPMPLIAVGGVSLENAKEFRRVAAGLGIGSALYRPGKCIGQVKRDAELFVNIIRGQS